MATNFYKQNGSYYRSDNNAKILTPTDLQTFAKSGGKEIQAPSINPTTADLTSGMNVGSVISNLPADSSKATQAFAEQSLKQAQDQIKNLQSQLSQYSSKNEQVLNDQLSLEKANQANLQADTDRMMTDFQNKIEPLRNQVLDFAKTGINTATAQDAKGLVNQRIALANENVSYANLLKNELNKKRAGLASVNSANKIKLLDEYQSKININNAAMSALDGNINLANTILSGASQSLTDNINTQIQFNNMVNAMNQGKSKLIESNIEELKSKLKDVEANKTTIANLFVSNPTIATKAGLSLTDSKEDTTKKLTDFYTKNPQYTPENQAWIKSARDKYFDAGITIDDDADTVRSKLMKSVSFKNELVKNNIDAYIKLKESGLKLDDTGNLVPDTSEATIDDFVAAIGGQESSGDYNAENGRTKAYGKFQILPSNWPAWSSEYASNVLNISTRELSKTPENQEAVAKYKMEQYYNKYGNWEDVASMWYSGKPFSQVVSEGWADKKMGKGNEPSVREYVNSVMNRVNNISGGVLKDDNALIAQGIIDGSVPPPTRGQMTKEYKSVLAAIKKIDPSFSITQAATDYNAEMAFARTMNSAQMVSFFGNSQTVINSLDEVLDSSDELKRTKLRAFNKAEIWARAEAGDPIAAAFRTNFAVLQEELAKVFMGNASPTDASLELAAKALDSFASADQLKAQVEKIKTLISYRRNVYSNAQAFTSTNTNQSNTNDPLGLGIFVSTYSNPLGISF